MSAKPWCDMHANYESQAEHLAAGTTRPACQSPDDGGALSCREYPDYLVCTSVDTEGPHWLACATHLGQAVAAAVHHYGEPVLVSRSSGMLQ